MVLNQDDLRAGPSSSRAARGGAPAARGRAASYFAPARPAAVSPLAAAPDRPARRRRFRVPKHPDSKAARPAPAAPMGSAAAQDGAAPLSAPSAPAAPKGLDPGSGAAAGSGAAHGASAGERSAAAGGAAEVEGAAGAGAAAGKKPARPLSREQRRARALTASVLPFDAVTVRECIAIPLGGAAKSWQPCLVALMVISCRKSPGPVSKA